MRQPRFLLQLLWLQRCTPLLFVITAILFGWLGFSFTRRYTQMVFHNVHQKFDGDQRGADWFKEGFSNYDPSKPMFEDPSVETKEIEPELVPGELDSDLDFEQADRLNSEDYYSEEEWDSDWNQNPSSNYPRRRRVSNDPYDQEYGTSPRDEYGWESDDVDTDTPDSNEWDTSAENTWDSEGNPQWDESREQESYDYNYRYNYSSPVNPNQNTSGYSGYTTDLSPRSGSQSQPEAIPDYNTYPEEERAVEPDSYDSSDYNSEYETDWSATPPDSAPDPYNANPTPSYWTPEPNIDTESSSQWTPSSVDNHTDAAVELSVPGSSQSFSKFENYSTATPSSLGLEEVSIPNRVTTE